MDTTLESLLDTEAQRMDEVLQLLQPFLRPARKSDGFIELPGSKNGRGTEERGA